jgi:uncharacterized protein YndB with AHSA1/START domain
VSNKITVQAVINKDIDFIWKLWTEPEHITQWNFASDDWICPTASNDLQINGTFTYRMEAKNGSMGFDFSGKYDQIEYGKKIVYSLEDKREIEIAFSTVNQKTEITETFDAEKTNPLEMQRAGWQSILNNFKKYAESL